MVTFSLIAMGIGVLYVLIEGARGETHEESRDNDALTYALNKENLE